VSQLAEILWSDVETWWKGGTDEWEASVTLPRPIRRLPAVPSAGPPSDLADPDRDLEVRFEQAMAAQVQRTIGPGVAMTPKRWAALRPENRALLRLLAQWRAHPDEDRRKWWAAFEESLRANRLSFPESPRE